MQERKLSIVHIASILNVGGAEKMLITLANIQHAHGHKVKVITTISPGPLAEQLNKEIEVISLERKSKWNLLKMHKLIEEIKHFDIIHVHAFHNLRYVFLAMRLFGLRKIIFFHEHYGDVVNQPVTWDKKLIYPKVIFIGVTNNMKDWAIDKLHLEKEKVFVLPNIVLKDITVNSEQRFSNKKRLLLVSNFLQNKNLEFTIEVLGSLCKGGKEKYQLTIIGKPSDKNYHDKIQKLIYEKSLQHDVEIITDCDNIQPLLVSFDLALHTAISESGPLVLIEYLAQNLPFLANETGEVVQQVKNNLPEFVISGFNIDEWVSRIPSLLAVDKTRWQQALPAIFEKYFSKERYYKACMRIYETVLNENEK